MRDGYRNDCKSCNLAAKAARYRANPGAAKQRTREWQQANPERFRENQRRMRSTPDAKRRARDSYLRRKYGITMEQYDLMLAEQDGGCAICKRSPSESISLHVDHDHDTGRIRGLLCFRCNNSLGDLEDSPQLLMAELNYVDGPTEEERRLALARLAGLKASYA